MNCDAVSDVRKLLRDADKLGAGGVDRKLLAATDGDVARLYQALLDVLKSNPDLVRALYFTLEDSALVLDLEQLVRGDAEAAALVDFIAGAAEGSRDRLRRMGASEDEIEDTPIAVRFDVFTGAAVPAQARISVDFITRHARACYDATDLTTANLPLMLLATTLVPSLLAVEMQHAKAPRIKPGPMYRYHPERMRISRGYLKKALALWGAGRFRSQDEALAVMNKQLMLITEETNKALLEFGLREKGPDMGMRAMYAEHDLVQMSQMFVLDGKQIFDLPPRLVDMLAHSDSDDLQVSQLKTPFRTQYIHVGPRRDLAIEPGWRFDGAYVFATPNRISLTLTTVPDEPQDMRRWVYRPEPTFEFVFEAADFPLDIGTAVDVSVARWLAKLDEEAAGAPERQAASDAFASEMGLSPGSIVVVTEERVEKERARIMSKKDIAHRALSVVVNALCYLTAYPDDIERGWQEEAPTNLVEQLTKGKTPGARRRAEAELNAQGYGIVHVCGMHFRNDPVLGAEMEGIGNEMRTHWRRGHFRNQPHGPQRALRKLIWIMPILVNADALKEGSELPGRIYKVSGPPTAEQ